MGKLSGQDAISFTRRSWGDSLNAFIRWRAQGLVLIDASLCDAIAAVSVGDMPRNTSPTDLLQVKPKLVLNAKSVFPKLLIELHGEDGDTRAGVYQPAVEVLRELSQTVSGETCCTRVTCLKTRLAN